MDDEYFDDNQETCCLDLLCYEFCNDPNKCMKECCEAFNILLKISFKTGFIYLVFIVLVIMIFVFAIEFSPPPLKEILIIIAMFTFILFVAFYITLSIICMIIVAVIDIANHLWFNNPHKNYYKFICCNIFPEAANDMCHLFINPNN